MTDFCEKIQNLGKGISSPSRYKLLEALMTGRQTVTELVTKVKLSQPAVSQHLSTLRDCGLVESVKHGQEVYYSLNARYMLQVLQQLTSGVEQCDKLLQPSRQS